MTPTHFKFIDLFAGIGGFRIALDNLEGECVFSSDIDLECQKTYQANFGELPFGDITKIDPENVPQHDVLCAGFPCQPFSICGLQRGFEDTRGTLFFNIMQIIKAQNPSIVFLENVKHLKHHDKGRTLEVIVETLQNEGYFVNWKVLNAKNFGLAQNRERIIIIGTKNKPFNFNKITTKKAVKIRDILETRDDFSYLNPEEYTILDRNLWKVQESGLIFCGFRNKSIRTKGTRPDTEHLSRVHKQPNRIYHIDGTHPTIPSQEVSGRFFIYDGEKVRKMTIKECFRLQGFPDDYKKISSNGNLYKQIGNSVAIPMIQAVGEELVKSHLIDRSPILNHVFSLEKVSVMERLF
jgi:DNA (cytosine-5)-methyltransferase 1